MKKLAVITAVAAICLAVMPRVSASADGGVYGEYEIAEFLSGDIRLGEIRGVAGVVVGPGCRLTVTGDVEAGESFISRGGEVRIYGSLYAGAVWLDSAEGRLRAELGSVVSRYYTQSGGSVRVTGSIVTRADEDYDGLGLVNINCGYALNNKTRLSVGGGIFARGGDIVTGNTLPMDEAEWASFTAVRGAEANGYEDTPTARGEPVIATGEGIYPSDGGKLVENGE